MNSVRQTIHNVREEARASGTIRERLSIERHWLALIAAMLVVFACFFGIGRASHSSNAPGGEPPSTLRAAAVKVSIPIALASAPAIEANEQLEAIAVAERRAAVIRARAQAIANRRSLKAAPTSVGPVLSPTPAAASTELSAPASSSAPTSTESPPVAETSEPSSPASTSGAGHSGSSAGGGSFDSSG